MAPIGIMHSTNARLDADRPREREPSRFRSSGITTTNVSVPSAATTPASFSTRG